jgi:transposase
MTIKEFQKEYGTRNACLEQLLKLRISKNGCCFNKDCNASIKDYYAIMKNRPAFICRRCLKHFHPMSGGPFNNTHVHIEDWFAIIYDFILSRNGVSAKELQKKYGFSSRTAFNMLHTIREMMQKALDFSFEGTVVEVDESYVNTGNKGLGRHYKFKRGRGSDKSTSFLTIVERGGEGRAKMFIIPNTDADSIIPKILQNVSRDTIIYTDSWGAYNQLQNLHYQHSMVNHSFEFVNVENSASTNTAENIHSNFKRMVIGTYRSISHKYSQNYANEHAFRHSFRTEKDFGFLKLLQSNMTPMELIYNKARLAA